MRKMIHAEEQESNCCGCSQNDGSERTWRIYAPAVLSFILLLIGIAFDNYIQNNFFTGYIRLIWYLVAYIPVGFPVIKEAVKAIMQKDFFNEFSLMSIATLGAFSIGEYPEGVAVMLFYSIGELFQESAVNKAKNNIKALLDIRPDSASVLRDGRYKTVSPESVAIGETIQVKVGEKVPLDGVLLSAQSTFNTSALTGESRPKTIREAENVLAGMVNLDNVIEVKVGKEYSDSSLAKILEMVQDATSRKAKTELLIRRFAKIYTPIVFLLALLITIVPYFLVDDYSFKDWLYRALVFLVISCPCALVISIPLGYFGGIGAASRNGILFKGANYLDLMTKVNTVVMDKTGTLTKGVFKVQNIVCLDYDERAFMGIVAALESHSNHPIAKAIGEYRGKSERKHVVANVKEISGYGLQGEVDSKNVLAGNSKLLQKYNIDYDRNIDTLVETVVVIAIDNKYSGYITVADEEKEDAALAISEMYKNGIKQTVILSGDNMSITQQLAERLGIKAAYGDLLPEDKVGYIENLKADKSNVIAFVGDGINDAPSLALSDIGIAMGGMGSDAAIEVADVIIQTDQPSKIVTAIKIAKYTKQIVVQNIILAFVVKALVLILGAGGLATMWEAVFADVGVALLAILNAVRILNKKF
ncbi:heavy metal translocating P-type ATPase [Dysgonomonas sp. ZJ279]|uniref:heavy metal translocating P-type ATPase n=1 Tax=Dysgonomonas sp. ZJ279 TaxID=2709796 RepID=UPI0021024D43|nr:heavy metal translocating P-type ATPase [Dysgonomonas sp. ZJ279]